MSNYFQKILIIDDDTLDRMCLKKEIRELDLAKDVVEADNGMAALDLLTAVGMNYEKFPELIFLDENMPSMDGGQFLEAFFAHHFSRTNRYRIVMMSSLIDEKKRDQAFAHEHVIAYYEKPLSKADLLELRDRFLHSNAS